MTCGGNVVHKPSYGWHLACLGDQRMWVVCSQAMFVGYQIVDTLFGWTTIGTAAVNRLHRPFSRQPAFKHSMLLCPLLEQVGRSQLATQTAPLRRFACMGVPARRTGRPYGGAAWVPPRRSAEPVLVRLPSVGACPALARPLAVALSRFHSTTAELVVRRCGRFLLRHWEVNNWFSKTNEYLFVFFWIVGRAIPEARFLARVE